MSRAHLHVLTEQAEDLRPHYLLSQLSRCWQEDGHRVTAGPRLEGELGLLHVDRTVVPAEMAPTAGQRVLNGAALDISKRRVAGAPLTPDSDWGGPVILKTNANYHGLPERNLAERHLPLALRFARRLWDDLLPWRWARRLPLKRYPILPRLADVPDWVWRDEALVVQRFTPERERGSYVLRIWVFVGDRGVLYRMVSDDPFVKSRRILRYEVSHELPPEPIQAARRRLGLDFGKLDFVLYEGAPVLLDANKTPAASVRRTATPEHTQRLRHLAGGLQAFLGGV